MSVYAEMESTSLQDEDFQWAERGDYWHNFNTDPIVRGRKPRFLHGPLILSGHGLNIRIDRGSLLIRNGFTHYPQVREETRYFPKDRRLPSRIVIVDGDGAITFDALEWLSVQGVPLVQINWSGQVTSTTSNLGYGADARLMRAQMLLSEDDTKLTFGRYLIDRKIQQSIHTLQRTFGTNDDVTAYVSRIEKWRQELVKEADTNLAKLLGIEGHAAQAYFRCWHSRTIDWKGLGRKPIPTDWHKIGSRMTTEDGNQFARHPLNAILNYAYGMLEHQVRTMILAMGFDPTIGFLHTYEPRRSTFVFDLMEPLRPIVDQKILDFILSNKFTPGDFVISDMGVCKLHPQLARIIVKIVQDLPEVEKETALNLQELMRRTPKSLEVAQKNLMQYKNKVSGRREKATS